MNNFIRNILLCYCFFLTGIHLYAQPDSKQPDSNQMIALATQADENGNYNTGIKWVKLFFEHYLNTVDCHWEAFTTQMRTLKHCMYAQGLADEYDAYKELLIRQMDASRQGFYLRAFVYLLTDYKANYYMTEDDWHTFRLHGDNTKALQFFDCGIHKISPKTIQENPFVKIWLYILKSDLYMYGGDYSNAQDSLDEALRLVVESFGKNSREYVVAIMFQEVLCAYKGDYKKAIELALTADKLIRREKVDYKELYVLNSRLQYYYRKSDVDKSIKYGSRSIVRPSIYNVTPCYFNFKTYEGEGTVNSPSSYLTRLNNEQIYSMLADACYDIGDRRNAAAHANKILYLLSKEIKSNYNDFAFNRASERLKRQVDYLVKMAPLYSSRINGDSLLQSLTYNAALLYKQLTLNADKLFRNHIAGLHNAVLSQRYNQLVQTRKQLDYADASSVDSLLKQINKLELNLLRHMNGRIDQSQIKMPVWNEIQAVLKPDDVAIEFTDCLDEDGKTMYLASIVTSDSKYPVTVKLFEESMLDSISDIYTSTESYNLLWKPLEPYFADKERIYFSPTRRLYQIGIEYFSSPYNHSRTVSDDYSMYRLSSTRELVTNKKKLQGTKSAMLYGGIKYELDEEELTQKEEAVRGLNLFNDRIKDIGETVRAGLTYLPGTKQEVQEISKILRDKSIKTMSVYGEQATESSIKMLSGQSLSILHIATHGFYMKRTGRSRLGRLLATQDKRSTFEEKSLNRSGLMFAGAANSVNGKQTSFHVDDGILTAKEISRLDFTRINMVVLSACETGLGDLSSEGVLGLQRGLKRAGAQSIVMSLWKVDDEATQILMKEFYRNLVSGKSECDSFKMAQRFLRTTENGRFSNPAYWASFVIQDALD